MPRQARTQSPTGYSHVMMRGNNRENIFVTDEQKWFFMDFLKMQQSNHLIEKIKKQKEPSPLLSRCFRKVAHALQTAMGGF